MRLRLTDAMIRAMRSHGERVYPAECCGAIAGRAQPAKHAVRLYPLQNQRTDDPHRYLIDPDQFREVERSVTAAGWEILGFYHSHPDHPAEPSAFDVSHAWPWYSYVIVRVDEGRAADIASWVLATDEARMYPETLEVESEA
jgi:proteasome lid subunit RPN8/RPN11